MVFVHESSNVGNVSVHIGSDFSNGGTSPIYYFRYNPEASRSSGAADETQQMSRTEQAIAAWTPTNSSIIDRSSTEGTVSSPTTTGSVTAPATGEAQGQAQPDGQDNGQGGTSDTAEDQTSVQTKQESTTSSTKKKNKNNSTDTGSTDYGYADGYNPEE